MLEMLKEAKKAKNEIANLSTEKKNLGLEYMAQALKHNKKKILEANSIDLENAKDKITEVMLDRLRLTDQRIEEDKNLEPDGIWVKLTLDKEIFPNSSYRPEIAWDIVKHYTEKYEGFSISFNGLKL